MKYLMIPAMLLVLSGCSALTKTVEIDKTIKAPIIAKAQKPKPVVMNPVYFHVVTEENLEEFITEIKKTGEFVFIGISVDDYENMALNVTKLRRYIKQQKQVVLYYEKNLLKDRTLP